MRHYQVMISRDGMGGLYLGPEGPEPVLWSQHLTAKAANARALRLSKRGAFVIDLKGNRYLPTPTGLAPAPSP